MRFVFCILFVLFHCSVQATELTRMMQQAKADPQAQLTMQLKKPPSTATEFFLLAYSHYALKNKEAALEFSNKALTLQPGPELAGRILLTQALTFGVYYRDTAQAIEKLTLAQSILPEENSPELLALRMDILESFAQAYNQQGKAQLAMEKATASLELASQVPDKQRQLDAMIMLGRLHLQNDDVSNAYQQFKSALPIASELDDKPAIASISLRLGMAYQKLQQHELALQHFAQATELYQQLDMLSGQVNALINKGDSQLALQLIEDAKATYDHALQLALQVKDPHMIISAYVSQSEIYLEQNKLDQAEQLLTKAHQLATQLSAQSVKSETALLLANVFIKKQDFTAAEQLLNEAAPEPEKLAGFLQRKHLELSATLAASQQQWQQAYQLEKSANQLEVAELNANSKIQVDSLQNSLELKLQQAKLQESTALQQSQLKQWLLISLICLAFLVLLTIFLLLKQKKRYSQQSTAVPQWQNFTELLLHYHKAKTQGHLVAVMPLQHTVSLTKGVRQVLFELSAFRELLDKALFWVEQDQEFWLYCGSEQDACELQQQLLQSLPSDYQAHSAILPLHALLSKRISERDLDALRELLWYSLYLAQQQQLHGAMAFSYQCNQVRPCAWQAENLRQDLFNAISLGLLEIKANGLSLSDALKQQLVRI